MAPLTTADLEDHAPFGADPTSVLHAPAWRPTLPSTVCDGGFRIQDLLAVAGGDPAGRRG